MTKKQKCGFIYVWYDRKHKKYYVGCHWGHENDGYICSSPWMTKAYKRRPNDFKRRIIKANIEKRVDMYLEEQRFLNMIKPEEIKIRYYNLKIKNNEIWHKYDENIKTIGHKISLAKTGKSVTFLNPEERARKISESKKKKFLEMRQSTGSSITFEHSKNISNSKKNFKHSKESKHKISESLKSAYDSKKRHKKTGYTLSNETKQKISDSLKGKKLSKEQIDFLKEKNSKSYNIEFKNGDVIKITGLKKYALDNNIPYVTLNKMIKSNKSSKKYNINKIEET